MKKIQMQLTSPHWKKSPQSEIYLRGTIFTNGVMHRAPENIENMLPQPSKDIQSWHEAIANFNGFFSLVWQAEGQLVAAVDRIRSIPLFYGQKSEVVFISDDAEWIRQQIEDDAMDEIACAEFQLTGYVTGKETLYPNVKQLQAGELLIVNEIGATPTLITHRYYRFLHTEPNAYDEAVLRQALENSAMDCIKRLIDYADGRQIVIPLSGGYDSRLIATLLSKCHYKKILTYSYGIKGNKESAYSQQVAKALGLTWHFVEYSNVQWRRAWNTEERKQYQKWASGWVSFPHIQDWVAVRELKRNETVDKDCVFVPGHSGDFVAGSHIPDEAFQNTPVTINTLVEKILQSHYSKSAGKSGPQARFNTWKERVIYRTEVQKVWSQIEFADAFEKWDWQERQAKYIINSVRVYEFFGYDWWLPFWDSEFMKFWQGVPLVLREKRQWYLDYVKRTYAVQIDINVENSLNNAGDIGFLQCIIHNIVAKYPTNVKDYLKVVRYRVIPKRITNEYLISHLSISEIKKFQNNGYCMSGMLIHEFLRLIRQ